MAKKPVIDAANEPKDEPKFKGESDDEIRKREVEELRKRKDAFDAARGSLEPVAMDFVSNLQATYDGQYNMFAAVLSSAISLKRIADRLHSIDASFDVFLNEWQIRNK